MRIETNGSLFTTGEPRPGEFPGQGDMYIPLSPVGPDHRMGLKIMFI